jgi:hypothetical protein
MKYKIIMHYMPWEIDYAMLSFQQIKRSLQFINLKEDSIELHTVLNVSDSIIDWDNSKFVPEFFVEKFEAALYNEAECNFYITKIFSTSVKFTETRSHYHMISREVCVKKMYDTNPKMGFLMMIIMNHYY